jgi:NAD(P)-dependent dehydrogenase (short-subunit alcohol dehydrogenase family)
MFTTHKNGWGAYCHSKLLNLLFAKYLSRTEPDIRTVSIHPGVIPGSGFTRNLPSFLKPVGSVFSKIPLIPVIKPQEGSIPILYSGLHPSVESGAYITKTEVANSKSEADDIQTQNDLYEQSQLLYEEYR